ncbi:MAG: bifunctional lysylphosphatidylglycerol flippase/synthetase MprF [Candidatus Binatia bacterium]|nr:bifunctional lysylphosphatidylglycerol flippase/synthetase MprF [Candidatus Binatia bacterium]
MLTILRRYGPPLLGVVLVVGVGFVLHRELRDIPTHQILAYARSLPTTAIAISLLLSALSYIVLTAYDALALVYIDHWLPYRRISMASFVGYVVNHNLGPIFLGGSAVRYRLYSSWGLSSVEIAKVIGFTGLTFWLGFLTLGGVVLIGEPQALRALVPLDADLTRLLGLVGPVLVGAYLVRCSLRSRPIRLRSWQIEMPAPKIGTAQIAVSSADWLLASTVLWVLLPDTPTLTFPIFFGSFLLAQVIGVASAVPAGLGVFEATLLIALAPYAPKSELLGAVLVFRGVYYVVPLAVASLLLGGHELLQRKSHASEVGRIVGSWVPEIVPQALALLTFIAGLLLVVGGTTPTAPEKLEWLARALPLSVLNLSNFLASLIGMALVLLARGLQLRLNAAWALTSGLLAAGAAFSLLRAFDLETTAILAVALLALIPCRRHFYRRSSLLDEPLTPSWTFAAILVLVGAGWLLLFSYRHVEYQADLWWQFELSSQASRGLRALAGAAIAFVMYGAARLLRPAPPDPEAPSDETWERIESVVRDSPVATAHLALAGDKSFLLTASRNAFVMYGVAGTSFIALGDPIGPQEETRDLAWQFHALAGRHGARTVFYEVGSANLATYVDLGLNLLKLGQEAHVPLEHFSLDGPERARLRRAHRQATQDGAHFEIVPPNGVDEILPELQTVSDTWLAEKNTREKGFSLGRFDRAYLRRFPIAIVRTENGIVAFANLWESGQHAEMSFDLMRHLPGGPAGLMDFLFIEGMQWARARGYQRFGLGLAPFSGMDEHALAPLWSRAGGFLYRHGEHFYNFQGLRQYKDKFDPEWTPRYLASPGGFALPRILTDVASLVSGGVVGIVKR